MGLRSVLRIAGGNQNGSDKGQAQGAAQPAGYPVVVTPSPALPAAWLGQDVRVTIKAASTAGPVMVVPVAAVSTDQSGSTSVTILKSGDQIVLGKTVLEFTLKESHA